MWKYIFLLLFFFNICNYSYALNNDTYLEKHTKSINKGRYLTLYCDFNKLTCQIKKENTHVIPNNQYTSNKKENIKPTFFAIIIIAIFHLCFKYRYGKSLINFD